jgi:hypothetical protein
MMGRQTARLAALAVVLAGVLVSGCVAASVPKAPPTPQETFKTIVAQADAASAKGDAETAYKLYSQALLVTGAKDEGTRIAGLRDKAKGLHLARQLLTRYSGTGNPENFIEIVQYAPQGTTESAAGRKELVRVLEPDLVSLRSSVAELKKEIRPGGSARKPLDVDILMQYGPDTKKSLAGIPGPFGKHAAAYESKVIDAAKFVYQAFNTHDADVAQSYLTKASRSLDGAATELQVLKRIK